MKLIQRLYLRDFYALLLLISVGLSCVFSLIDLIGKIDEFLPSKPSLGSLVLYAVLTLPKFFVYLLPMSVLICSLFTFSQASKRREIIAIKAAGGRLLTLSRPFVASGLLISAIAFFVSEVITPVFSTRAAELRSMLAGKGKKTIFTEGAVWIKDRQGNPVKIDLFIPENELARGITIFVRGEAFLTQTIHAQTAVWKKDRWVLENVSIHTNETGRRERFERMEYLDLESPELFSREMRTAEDMGIFELYRHMQRLKNAGVNAIKLVVDLNTRVSFPTINIFMMLLGISLANRSGMGGGLFTAGLGLVISLAYWFSYTFSLSIGYAGIVPAGIAAWSVPVIFGSLAVYLFTTTPE